MFPLIAASLLLALFTPSGMSDPTTRGVPDFTCQTPAEWAIHDYAAPATGGLISGVSDNNLEECGTTYGFFIAGDADCEAIRDNLGEPVYTAVCRNDRPADYDGDLEFAHGGAILAARSAPSGSGAGALECLGTTGHHPEFGTVFIDDLVFGSAVRFTVTADWSRPELVVPGQPDCGDGSSEPCSTTGGPQPSNLPPPLNPIVDEVNALLYAILNDPSTTCNAEDRSISCFSRCSLPFGSGADGTYTVFVEQSTDSGGNPTLATQGHISTVGYSSQGGVGLPAACSNGLDDDLDGDTDYPDEFDCTSEHDLSETCLPEGCVDTHQGLPDPDLDDPTANVPPPPTHPETEEGVSIASCHWVHPHGNRYSSNAYGYYFLGDVYAHYHHCGGGAKHASGAYTKTWGARADYVYHDTVKIWWVDWEFHYTCVTMYAWNGNSAQGCWWQHN